MEGRGGVADVLGALEDPEGEAGEEVSGCEEPRGGSECEAGALLEES